MLKRFAPKSLYGRTILIVVLPIFLMQAAVTYVFFNRHWEEVTASLAKSTASDFGMMTLLWTLHPSDGARAELIEQAREELGIEMTFVSGGQIPDEDSESLFNALNRTLDRELDWSLDYPYSYDTTSFRDVVETRVQLENGYLVYKVSRDRVVARNGHFFLLWLIGVTLLLGYTALIFLRNQVRSITRLADAADRFGRGEDVAGFKPSGAREVRLAGHAFIAMRARIKRFLDQRTEMLAGVSHDLKTPLTRLKLNLAMQSPSDDIKDMQADIDEMERLLNDYLTFARGDAAVEREWIDVNQLAEDLKHAASRQGRTLATDIPSGLGIIAHGTSLSRALTNLVENAYKFAETVSLSATKSANGVELIVDDDGPGIAPDDRGAALKAFGRLDQARNTNVAGSGLGLSIVRDVARAHGGSLRLEESPLGGLRAVMSLPPAAPDTDD
ncbi:ATP-binding protein [Parvularcula sp. LCG005]|uniref:ATP-binding protein n=1 Tax=Parvularcula sp. LCG005 TaxID=3078805 RepID=UPI00294356E7|nr:ATP-binding protein [Parvularcula sp. LCG005]WOI54156.1 ATP-binding protein [Parvularcula sp. LCG005]